jgi:nucleotide-binding universal stress UspA family protein
MSFRNILIAVDDSPLAAEAAKVGVQLAESLGAAVGFINVFDPSVGPGAIWGLPADRTAQMSEQAGKDLIATFRNRTAVPSGVREWIEPGMPASKIVEVAKKWPADLVVVGSHGRGNVGGFLLGSVSQAVLHHAPCAVLVVRSEA